MPQQPKDLSDCIRAYQAAADYYGAAQAQKAAAAGAFTDATDVEAAAYRAYITARDEMLTAARDVQLPARP